MTILVVEDNPYKKEVVGDLLNQKNIKMLLSNSVNPALRYILEHKSEISGIILDLGLTSEDNSTDYEDERGLDLVKELTRKEINIPILINSTTTIDLRYIMKNHSNVKGQTSIIDDGYEILEWFITTLKEGQ